MESYNRLLTCNIKPSMQRMAILDYLMEHHTHPSADEIFVALSPSMPTLSKTTVYNTLKLFAECGAVQMLTIEEKNTTFDSDMTPHAHFLCKKCSKIYDLHHKIASREVEGEYLEDHEVTEIHYYYKGYCKSCLKNNIY